MITQRRGTAVLGSIAVVSIALLAWKPVDNDDTFMYLATGNWVVDHGRIPRADPFSWTFHGHAWQSAGWGWGVILSSLDRVAGLAGVAATKPLLVCALAAGVIWVSRRSGARVTPAWLCVIAALLCLSPWVSDRAQMASYALLPVALGLAGRATDDGRFRFQWAFGLVALQILWVNVHSAALISVPYLAAYLGGRALDSIVADSDRRLSRILATVLVHASVLVVAVLALLINPWGLGMLRHAEATRTLSQATISEWAPLVRAGPIALLPVAVAVVALVGFLVRRHDARWGLILPCVVGFAMTVDAIRNAPFFILAVAMFLPATLPRFRNRWAARRDLGRVGAGALGIIAVVVASVTVGSTDVPGPHIPIRSTAVLPSHCQLRNKSDMGGYVLATRPDVPVSADGRNDLYGLRGYAQNTWFTGGERAARLGVQKIDDEGTTCVLARPNTALVSALVAHGWKMIGRDPSGVALVRPRGTNAADVGRGD